MILALHTAGPTTHIWAIKPGTRPTQPSLTWESGHDLAADLYRTLVGVLDEHNFKMTDVTGFVVFSGPGSFTSLRIGHAVANSLAHGLSVPVVGEGGEEWLSEGLAKLEKAPIGVPVMPHYGAEANISKPKSA